MLSFIVFGVVLFVYSQLIFTVFVIGSLCYALWISAFLRRRKVIDYELFECQAVNQNRTYQFITTMQEINCRTVSVVDAGNGRMRRPTSLRYGCAR